MNTKEVNFKRTSIGSIIARTQSEAIQKTKALRVKPAMTTLLGKVVMLFAFCFLLSTSIFAQNPGGTTGSLTWELNLSDSTLTISGNDTMPNYKPFVAPQPWLGYRDNVAVVIIENDVKSVGKSVFTSYPYIRTATIGNSVITIGNEAFSGCRNLTSLIIGNSVTTIGDCAFCDGGFTSVILPSSLTTIKCWAFVGSSLISITIPKSVTKIEYAAFMWCEDLISVTVQWTKPLDLPDEVFIGSGVNVEKIKLYVPKGTIGAYRAANVWKDFDIEEYEDNSISSLHSSESINVYPNPVTDQLRITNYELRDNAVIEIFSIVGQVIGAYCIRPESNETIIDISHLSNGIYFMKLDGKTVKIVKQ